MNMDDFFPRLERAANELVLTWRIFRTRKVARKVAIAHGLVDEGYAPWYVNNAIIDAVLAGADRKNDPGRATLEATSAKKVYQDFLNGFV